MILSHKIELTLNEEQEKYCCKAAGTARFAYNWALSEWQRQYELFKNDNSFGYPSESKLRKQLNSIKKENYPWMYDVSKCVVQQSIINLGVAFNRFVKKESKHPVFKKKNKNDSFYLGNDVIKIIDNKIIFPNLKTPIKMKERIRFNGKINYAVVSRISNKWFISFSIELNDNSFNIDHKNQMTVGIDLGLTSFATLFDGEKSWKIDGVKPYKSKINRLKLLSKRLSKKSIKIHELSKQIKETQDENQLKELLEKKELILKGKNYIKAKVKLSKLHVDITNLRKDFLHKTTTHLAKNYSTIKIETLNIRGLVKNHCLSRSILDRGFYTFRRQLEYKCIKFESTLISADRFYPSSKLCSICGTKNTLLTLKDRQWLCICGALHDRDINAAINLQKY